MNEKISIGIVDDDEVCLESTAKFLSSKKDMEVVFKASNRNDAIKYIESCKPQIILMDIDLKDKNYTGIEITREILEDNPHLKVIMLTSYEEENLVLESARAGAINYISKNEVGMDPEEIIKKIRKIVNGFNPYSIISGEIIRREKESMFDSLTAREKEIYELIHKDMNKKQIAQTLFLEENTVKNNITSILKKLSVKNCKEIIKKYRNS